MSKSYRKKIVITGAGGFLGSNLVNELIAKEEYFVYALSSRGDQLQSINDKANLKFCQKDAFFSDEDYYLLEDSIVVNCAFPRNTDGYKLADGLKYIERLFDKSVECNAMAVINISSQSVYSQKRKEPATEETPVCLESVYAVGKYATELMLEQSCQMSKVFYTNIRLSSLIGPGFNQRIVNRLTERALNMMPIKIIESKNKYGFLDVLDAVRGIQALINLNPQKWNNTYNLGGCVNYSMTDILNELEQVFLERELPFPNISFEQSGEDYSLCVNSDMFFNDTKFRPSVTLNGSIKKIINWYCDQK